MATVTEKLVIELEVKGAAQAKAKIANALGGGDDGGGGGGGGSNGGGSMRGMSSFFIVARIASEAARAVMALSTAMQRLTTDTLNTRDILGSTFGQASRMSSMMMVAGAPGAAGEAQKFAAGQFQPGTNAGMNILGVHGKDTIQNFFDIVRAMQNITDGARKAQIGIMVFGEEGYKNMLPVLRMAKDITDRIESMSNAFKPEYADHIEHLRESFTTLGEEIMVKLIIPLADTFIPVVEEVIKLVSEVVDGWQRFNNALGGLPGYVLAFSAIAASIAAMTIAFTALLPAILRASGAMAVFDALTGNGQALAAAAAIGVAMGVGSWAFDKYQNTQDEIAKNTRDTANALRQLRIGAVGPVDGNTNRVMGEIESEYNIRRRIGALS